MPSYTIDFPEDDNDPNREIGGDEQVVGGTSERKPLRGDRMTHREVDSIMDELGLPKQGRSSKTINEKLFDIAQFMKESGTEIDIVYSKKGPRPKQPKKQRIPKRAGAPKPKARQTKVPTLLGSLFGSGEKQYPKKITDELESMKDVDLSSLSDEDKATVMDRVSKGERLKDILSSLQKPKPRKKPKQSALPMSAGPKKSTRERRKYFDKREERRAIQQEEKFTGEIDFPFGANVTPPPPRKPPAPPSGSSSPGDEGDDDEFARFREGPGSPTPTITQGDLEKTRKEFEAQERRAQDAELRRLQKDLANERRRAREDQQREFQARRKRIMSEAQRAQKGISEAEASSTSDRIIRRLASFGIGRAVGGSGSLFAAGMEFGVFQPQEQRAQAETKKQREAARLKKERELEKLEQEIFKSKRGSDIEQERVSRAIDEAKLRLSGTRSINERQDILDDLKRTIRSGPTASPLGGSGSPAAGRGRGGSGGGQPPSGPSAAGSPESRALIGPIDTTGGTVDGGGPGGPGGRGPGGGGAPGGRRGPNRFSRFLNSPTGLTLGSIATLGITEAAERIKETVNRQVQAIGSVVNINPLTQSGISQTGNAVGQGATNAARVGGFGAGALIGGALGGPAGAFFGGAIGASAGGFAEPIVEAIKQGNSLLENFTKNSLDFATIGESANQEVITLLRKIEADEAVSDTTVEFRRSQGDLTRSIIGLQEALISEFGDDLTNIVKSMALLVKAVSVGVEYSREALGYLVEAIPFIGPILTKLDDLITWLGIINDSITDGIGDDAVSKEVVEFFSTQNQFQTFQNGKPATRFGTNVNAFAGP